ncbi:MAG: glycosyltransferase [Myxococcota bacterium]
MTPKAFSKLKRALPLPDLKSRTQPLAQRLRSKLPQKLRNTLEVGEAVQRTVLAPTQPYPIPGVTPRDITVIVPVYNGFAFVKRCLDSVVAHLPADIKVIVVDDASTEEPLLRLFEAIESQHPQFSVARNDHNLGYTGSVNRGISLSRGDVVLLNSDTEVTSGWLDKLWSAAYSRPAVATVTATSNAAGAFSVPFRGNRTLPTGIDVERAGWLIEGGSDRKLPPTPTGNGFCMYVTRQALERVGVFDERAFPRGYGEENDFAMRAAAHGMSHVVDDSTFVFHRRSATFGDEKQSLMDAGAAVISSRYPDYHHMVQQWLARDALQDSRRLWTRAWSWSRTGNSRRQTDSLLYVIHDAEGGAVHTTYDLAARAARFRPTFLLRLGPHSWTFERVYEDVNRHLHEVRFGERWNVFEPMGVARASALLSFLERYPIGLIHVRHLLGAGPELLLLLRGLGYPVVFSFHDFLSICPNIQLVNNRGRYCAGVCNTDVEDCGVWDRYFVKTPRLKNALVHQWRNRVARGLGATSAFVTTSETSKSLITSHYPRTKEKPFPVIPHGRTFLRRFAPVPPQDGYRLVTLGGINLKKGGEFLIRILSLAKEEDVPLRLHVFGKVDPGIGLENNGAIVHGPYDREGIVAKLHAIGAAAAILPSIMPETYCHTLTEAWAAGLPVFASKLGALGERVTRSGAGWTFDPNDPASSWRTIIECLNDNERMEKARSAVSRISFRGVEEMYDDYDSLYDNVLASHHVAT